MQTVLITGVAGMVGSHLVDYYCTKTNYNIIGVYYKPTIDFSRNRWENRFI